MIASHAGIILNLLLISSSNKIAQKIPSNNNASLVSRGKICNDDCEVRINKKHEHCAKKQNETDCTTLFTCRQACFKNIQNKNKIVNASLGNREHKVSNIQEFIDVDRVKSMHASIGGLSLRTAKQSIKVVLL